jgi:2EXR family
MSDNPRTLKTFTLFPNLPFELRCLIWETSCESRTVEIAYDSEDGFLSSVDPPIALEVCRESRNHLLNNYPLCFGSIYHPPKIRFNFSIDTLYMDNSMEDDMAHVFSTFREREISSLKYLALDTYYGNTPIEDDFDPFDGVKRAVKSLTGLRELLVVFHVDTLSPRIIGCGGDHNLALFDKLPADLAHPKFELPSLSALSLRDFECWELAVPSRPIYGWRRCPDNDDIMASPRAFFGGDFDSDDDDSDREWGGIPFPIALGMGMFHPDDEDSEMDDDDDEEDDKEDETTDDEMPDLGSDTDDEMPGLGSASEDEEHRSEAASLD